MGEIELGAAQASNTNSSSGAMNFRDPTLLPAKSGNGPLGSADRRAAVSLLLAGWKRCQEPFIGDSAETVPLLDTFSSPPLRRTIWDSCRSNGPVPFSLPAFPCRCSAMLILDELLQNTRLRIRAADVTGDAAVEQASVEPAGHLGREAR